MAARRAALSAAALWAGAVGTSLPEGCPAAGDCELGDESALLQAKLVSSSALQHEVSCCPGCAATCLGNQCCPGTAASSWLTYPCPMAVSGWNSCQTHNPYAAPHVPLPPSPPVYPVMPTAAPPTAPPPTPAPFVNPCGCDCSWLAHGQDDCRKDACADRCRVANGIKETVYCANKWAWGPNRNHQPENVYEGGLLKCNCQWMSANQGLGDDCVGGCSPNDCAFKCRQANPLGTCLAMTPSVVLPPSPQPAPTPAPTLPPTPAPTLPPTLPPTPPPKAVVHACGCDCSWLAHGQDDCRKDVCADRCRIANGIWYNVHCQNAYGQAVTWEANRNMAPMDVWEHGQSRCECGWMANNHGFGDDCRSGCSPNECAYKCRQANPRGTCMAQ